MLELIRHLNDTKELKTKYNYFNLSFYKFIQKFEHNKNWTVWNRVLFYCPPLFGLWYNCYRFILYIYLYCCASKDIVYRRERRDIYLIWAAVQLSWNLSCTLYDAMRSRLHKHTLVFSSLRCCCSIITTHKILHKHKQSTPTYTPPPPPPWILPAATQCVRSSLLCFVYNYMVGHPQEHNFVLKSFLMAAVAAAMHASHRVLMKSCLKYERCWLLACFVQHQPPKTLLYVFENLHIKTVYTQGYNLNLICAAHVHNMCCHRASIRRATLKYIVICAPACSMFIYHTYTYINNLKYIKRRKAKELSRGKAARVYNIVF